MISTFHLRQLEKRFPKCYSEYMENGGSSNWEKLKEWIASKGENPRYYSVALGKIEKGL